MHHLSAIFNLGSASVCLYCFTTSEFHGVENYFQGLSGVWASPMLFLFNGGG